MSMGGRGARGARLLLAIAAATGLAAANAAACGFDGIPSGSPADAGANLRDASDASAPIDFDATSEVPTTGPGFCAAQTAPFIGCWDFDGVTAGGDAGFVTHIDNGAITVIAEGENHALQVTVPDMSGSRNTYARLRVGDIVARDGRVYDLTFRFSVRQSSLDFAGLGALFVVSSTTARTVGAASYGKGSFVDGYPPQSGAKVTFPASTEWHVARARLASYLADLRGTVVVDSMVVDDQSFAQTMSGVDIKLGIYDTSAAPPGAMEVVFDDVILRAE
jgi:hypothetical protein